MKQERVILSFVMVLVGLLVAGTAFYFYQSTKTIPASKTNTANTISPTPTPTPKIYLLLSDPKDESVVENKILQIIGQTNPDATVVIVTSSDQKVLQPSSQGNFSTTITLNEGENLIKIQSILPDGEDTSLQRTVTYSTENF